MCGALDGSVTRSSQRVHGAVKSHRKGHASLGWCCCAIRVNVDDFRFLACSVFWGSCFVTIDRGAKYVTKRHDD